MSPEPKTLKEILLILALSVPLLFWGIGSIALLDPNEGMYGSIALEMTEQGEWITPRFNGVRYFHRPPLYFWLTALTIKGFGASEWAIRLWTVLPALGTALLVWRMGNLLYSRPAGLLSALVMLSSIGIFRYARVAASDFLLVFSVTLSIYGFVKAALADSKWRMANGEWQMANGRGREKRTIHCSLFTIHPAGPLLFWLGLALGALSKGLMGIILPLLIVALYALANGRRGAGLFAIRHSLFASPAGLSLFLAVTLPWYLLAAWQNPGFFHFHVVDNQFLRFLNQWSHLEDEVPATTGLFAILVFLWFFPWSLLLPAALRYGFSGAASDPYSGDLRLIVGSWAVAVIGFFSLSALKLEHYIMPAIPPMSLMTGGLWRWAFASKGSAAGLKWCLGAGAAVLGLLGARMISYGDSLTAANVLGGLAKLNVYYRILQSQGAEFPYESTVPFVQLFKLLGWAMVAGLPLSFVLIYLSPKASFGAILCLSGVIAALVFKLLLLTEPYHSTKSLAASINARAKAGDAIIHEGPLEYSGGLPFYTGKKIFMLNGRRGSLDFGSQYAEARALFLDDPEFLRLWEGSHKVFLVTGAPVRESILERLPKGRFVLMGQYGLRRLYVNPASAER